MEKNKTNRGILNQKHLIYGKTGNKENGIRDMKENWKKISKREGYLAKNGYYMEKKNRNKENGGREYKDDRKNEGKQWREMDLKDIRNP